MRLATIEHEESTAAAVVEGERVRILPFRDLRELLTAHGPRPEVGGLQTIGEADVSSVRFTKPVLSPAKTVCVGLNYFKHAQEANLAIPDQPLLFAKYDLSLIGPTDDILLPKESPKPDWEAELAIVIGREARRVPRDRALDVIAGYTVINDISMRDWQRHTSQFLPGKTFDDSTPFGPWIVTGDEIDEARDLMLTCSVNGEIVQQESTSGMIINPEVVIEYVSTFTRLLPGDVIAMGTPSGVGNAMKPPRYLAPGDVVVTSIEGIGELRNTCVIDEDPGTEA